MSSQPPSLFVPHGAPTFALRPGAAGAALAHLGQTLTRPRAILIASAHWNTHLPSVGFAERPETIHDFQGFPEALYDLRYPATGCCEAAREVLAALTLAGFPAKDDRRRGLDHGAWVPLRMLFPEADVPVIPLSIQPQAGPEHHYRIGQALAPLAALGFLIIGSGSITHNLGDYQIAAHRGGQTPAYVRQFADWLADQLQAGDIPALLNYRRKAPHAAQAHPTEEHLLPFFVALGVAGEHAKAQRLQSGIDDHVIAMDAYSFSPRQGG